jgi:Family of unknown function (DUF5519)
MPNQKAILSEKITSIPGVSEKYWPTENGGFTSFIYKGKDFAHFHSGNELDIRLTKKVIASEKLEHPSDSVDHPNRSKNSPWIEVRFNTQQEALDVYRLVELAIKQI